jgi:hypothetical protein
MTLQPIAHLAAVPPFMMPEHPIPKTVTTLVSLLFAVAWSSVYLMAIRRGFVERWLAIPLVYFSFNIAWEFMFSFIFHVSTLNRVINLIWFCLDLGILVQAMRYGRRDYSEVHQNVYRWSVAGLLVFTFAFMYALPHDLGGDFLYAAILDVCLGNLLFILMLRRRGSTGGQTMYIAAAKFVGDTAAFSLAISNYPHRLLFDVLFVASTFFEVLYLVELRQAFRKEGIVAWRKI